MTFEPQCEVKIVVFIVFLINANFATYYFNYYNVEFMLIFAWLMLIFVIILLGIIMLSLFLFFAAIVWFM